MEEKMIMEINQLLNEIQEVSDFLYQQKLGEGYKKLDVLIGHIMEVIDKLLVNKECAPINLDENILVNTLAVSMKAMEDKDSVLLADILSLELAKQFTNAISRI